MDADDEPPELEEVPLTEPISFDAVVVAERGRWWVEVIALYPDGVVRRRIRDYARQTQAEVAARMIQRGALRPPLG